MALPVQLLERLPAVFQEGGAVRSNRSEAAPAPLTVDHGELDAVLPDGGLPRGAVTELSILGGAAQGTTLSLLACRSAMEEAKARGGEAPWCAFVDPSSTLHGPGLVRLGIDPSRLLVVRPAPEALERVAIKLVESHAFPVVVVDTMGTLGASLTTPLAAWPRVVRRLSLAAEQSGVCVLLMTDGEAHRPLPLPVALRLELRQAEEGRLVVRIVKERRGRVSGPHRISWGRPRAKTLGVSPGTLTRVPA